MPNIFIPSAAAPFEVRHTARVDQTYGDDGTGTVGDLSKPYATVKAAANDAIKGNQYGSLIIGPGEYLEEVEFRVNQPAAGASWHNIIGSHGTSLRGFKILPAGAVTHSTVRIRDLSLGLGGGFDPALNIAGDIGTLTLRCDNVDIGYSVAGTEAVRTEHGGAFGNVWLSFFNSTVYHFVDSYCVMQGRGNLYCDRTEFLSVAAPCIYSRSQYATQLNDCTLSANAATVDVVEHSADAGGVMRMQYCLASVIGASTGNLATLGSNQDLTVTQTEFDVGGGSGGIVGAGANVYLANSTLEDGSPIPITSLTTTYLDEATSVGYAPAAPANWAGNPAEVGAAVDRIAAAVAGLLGVPIP